MPRGLCHLSNPLSWTDKNKYTIWTVSAYQAVRRIERNWRARMVTSCKNKQNNCSYVSFHLPNIRKTTPEEENLSLDRRRK